MEETHDEGLQRQLAEAEERGYQRGLNEQIAQKMQLPGEWEESALTLDDDGRPSILGDVRSIWD